MFFPIFFERVLPENSPTEAAYEMAFMPHGFTPRQFLKVFEACSGRIEEAFCGTYICRQGPVVQKVERDLFKVYNFII